MREIKFRVWFKDLQIMVNEGFDEEKDCLNKTLKKFNAKQNLMQYTGLKDNNGVEIYESDIIQCTNEETYIIEWHNEMCCFVGYMEDRDYEMFSYVLRPKGIKVIGNIYENRELLET